LSELRGVILTGIFPQCVDSRRVLDCAGELVSSRMYSFASLVALAIFPCAAWSMRSADINGLIVLSDVFWSVEMTIKYFGYCSKVKVLFC